MSSFFTARRRGTNRTFQLAQQVAPEAAAQGGGGGTTIVGMGNPATAPLEMGLFPINTNSTVDGRDVGSDGINQDALQTLVGVAPGTTQFPATTGTLVLPAANAVTRFQDIANAIAAAGGGSVNTVAGVAAVAGDIPLAALLTALGLDDIQTLLGVAAGTATLPAIPAGTGTVLNAGDLVTQLAELKNRIDAGGGAIGGDLTALEALAATGFAVRTAADTWAQRSLVAPAAGFTITNGDGVAGDPTFVLANDLAALEALAANGVPERTGADTWTQRLVGLLANNLVERTARFGIELGDNAAAPNAQRWFIDEADNQGIQFRYGATDAAATPRLIIPPGAGAVGSVLTITGANGQTAWQAGGAASPLTTAGDIYIRNATVDTRLPAPAENGKTLYSDSTVGEGLAWKGQVVSIADGGTLQPGFINRIADGATVTAPAAAGFADMNIGIMLAAGGTTATVNGAITAALTTPLQLQTYSSDGAAWNQYNSGASGAALDLSTNGGANVNTAAVSKIDIDGTRATLTETATPGEMNLALDDALVVRGDWTPATNTPDLTAAAQQVVGDAYRVSADGNIDIGNGAEDFREGDIVYRHTDGTWKKMQFSQSAAPITSTIDPASLAPGATDDTNIIAFAGAQANDGFVVGVPSDIAAQGVTAHAYFQSAGNVRLFIRNNGGTTVDLGAENWTIYKVNNNAGTNVPAAITGIAAAAGLVATGTAGEVGTSTLAAREDHRHPADPPSGDANNAIGVDANGFHYFDSTTLVNTVAGVAPTAGDVPSSADAQNKIETGSDGGLAVFDLKRIALTGAGAVSLALATHRERLVELTDTNTTSVNVATFAVGKTDGQAIDRAVIWNGTGAGITVAGGAGATAISDQAIALVQSVNGTALVTVLSGGIELAPGADGSVIVQVAGADTRVQQEDAITAEFLTGIDGSGRSWIATYDGEIFQGRGLAGANSYDVNVTIDGAAVTPNTITVNTTALATTAVTASRSFTKGQRVRMAFANAATATDGFFQLDIRRTGA